MKIVYRIFFLSFIALISCSSPSESETVVNVSYDVVKNIELDKESSSFDKTKIGGHAFEKITPPDGEHPNFETYKLASDNLKEYALEVVYNKTGPIKEYVINITLGDEATKTNLNELFYIPFGDKLRELDFSYDYNASMDHIAKNPGDYVAFYTQKNSTMFVDVYEYFKNKKLTIWCRKGTK